MLCFDASYELNIELQGPKMAQRRFLKFASLDAWFGRGPTRTVCRLYLWCIICHMLLRDLHALHAQVATKVAEEAISQGLGNIQKPSEGLHKFITDRMWDPTKANLNMSSNVEA